MPKIEETIIAQEINSINEEIDNSIEGYDLSNMERSHIFNMIEDEINGKGPLGELLLDKDITEIMVNGPKEIYIEIDGRIIKDESVASVNYEKFKSFIYWLCE